MFDKPDQPPLDIPASTADSKDDPICAATLREIDRIQSHETSWTNALLLLVFTAGFFLASGTAGFDWQVLLLVCGVLFIHESGHMAAMWLFGYRNLRMFFIPFFGAAVTGQNYNVPGWKKAVVSLMGPLPGILLGVALGVLALFGLGPELYKASLLLLFLNALNLLPILPLDGGWILHAVLFSRHPVLDVAFRLIAGLILALGSLVGMWFLGIIGLVMLISLPTAYRVAQVVRQFRLHGLEAISPDAQTVPEATARVIIHELRHALPANTDAKTRARLTLQVFESLNASPPDWLASLTLLGLQLGSFLMAIVFGVVLFVAHHAG